MYDPLLERAESLALHLDGEERSRAERVLSICRDLATRARRDGKLTQELADDALKQELRQCVEFLSRRVALALPMAKLGRAALADLAQDLGSTRALLVECDTQLGWHGL